MTETRKEEIIRHAGAEITAVCEGVIPTIYVDGFLGIAVTNGIIKINLTEEQFDPVVEKVIKRVIGRLAMSPTTLNSFYDALGRVKDKVIQEATGVEIVIKANSGENP